MPTLPDVKAKFVVDYSSLTAPEKASAKAHGEFQAGAKVSTTHTLRFEQSLTTLLDKFGHMPPVVNEAGRSLESMASQGVSGLTLLGGAAAAGLGIIVEFLSHAEEGYVGLAEKVENYRRVVGGTAENSSRMVEMFQALGVSEEAAAGSMFKLSKAIDQHAGKLTDLGIVVGRSADGNVDLTKTLYSVADAYNSTSDQQKKNTIVLTAFGKSGRDMIPILEQGSAALKDMARASGLIFSEDDLRRVREMKIHTEEAKQAFQQWIDQAGKPMVAATDQVATSELATIYAEQKLSDMHLTGAATAGTLTSAHAALIDKFKQEWYTSHQVKEALDQQTAAANDLAKADAAVFKEADRLINQNKAQFDSQYALLQANLAVKESTDKITDAQIRYRDAGRAQAIAQQVANDAIKMYGYNSEQAKAAIDALNLTASNTRKASDDVTRAVADQEKAYYDAGAAARKLQEDQDLLNGTGKSSEKEIQAQIDAWQAEADTLAPNSPLRKRLEGWIQDLRQIPTQVSTTLTLITPVGTRTGTMHGNLSFAAGGRPPVGVPSWVGEYGKELFTPDVPGTITPHGQGAGGADMSRVEQLLQRANTLAEALITVATAEPTGGDFVATNLYKAMQGAGLNRLRGMNGA